MRRSHEEIKELVAARCQDFIEGNASEDVLLASLKALGVDAAERRWLLWQAQSEKRRRTR